MANMFCWSRLLSSLITLLLLNQYVVSTDIQRKVYIVFMDEQPKGGFSKESVHLNVLEQVLEGRFGNHRYAPLGIQNGTFYEDLYFVSRGEHIYDSQACHVSSTKESLIYSYSKSFNGFAASLTDQELKKLTGMKGVVSVFPSRTLQLHTTRSWDFLNFPTTAKRLPKVESDVVVGFLDTGIWPESESFNDEGIGPPPSKWKGVCKSIKCNNKIIGARFYKANKFFEEGEEKTPRDTKGHGTHTASTVAGREVRNISLYGLAEGTARGAVPSARIAVYKVCWSKGCTAHDILAAFDDAIDDGVDILSLSLGGAPRYYYSDPIAIGSFHAMKKGILTSASAGNNGPFLQTVTNSAPWMLTVAANSLDRRIISKVTLGNGKTFVGRAINTFPTNKTFFPIVYGENETTRFCSGTEGSSKLSKGKIVLCNDLSDGGGPLVSGAQGTVMATDIANDYALSFPLPATVVRSADGEKIKSYMNSTRKPTANIKKSEAVHDPNAPSIVSFSARGPNIVLPGILKPDISAPGVDILAGWSPKGTVSLFPDDKRSVNYNILSGTSMSCPHATGAAAYVKTFHPEWSPAAIKSALMTTASPMKVVNKRGGEFAYGAGQIDPVKAVHPGLVYDTQESDYIQMLCDIGYTAEMIRTITQQDITCSKSNRTEVFLNYPSMTAYITSGKHFNIYFPRTVTNVGIANSTYKATISSQSLLNITVTPNVLSFKSLTEKQNFVVNITGGPIFPAFPVISAWLLWSDGVHSVRSPIIVFG